MGKQRDENRVLKACLTFGLSLGLQIYLLGVLLGGYLDERFAAAPYFTIGGVLLAIAVAFYQLWRQLQPPD